ncbi:hypothetical protein [Bizionia echini]|uniref:hypothetical protein n=1 Tax=Bizionia echini TaxID=649333 RepID=UPI0030DC4AF4
MRKFLYVALKLFFISILILIVLDIIYTAIYYHPKYHRNKVSWIKSFDEGQNFNYAVFGSSRAYFHINPKQIALETGQIGVNLAYPACTNFEIKLMVKTFLDECYANKIFIQIDKVYNVESIDQLAIVPWIPFFREPKIYEDIKAYDSLAVFKKYVPFYRYMFYDSKLGFRELSMTFLNNNKFENDLGFYGAEGIMAKDSNFVIKPLKNELNKHLKEIIDLCKEKEVTCYFFTAPYFNTEFCTQVLKEQLPNYFDFSDSVSDKNLFMDYQHLNIYGAEKFTSIFVKAYFENTY